jgi:dCTP deaminase
MILSDTRIREAVESGRIVIRPYRSDCLGTNSYDVHLGPYIATYVGGALDARRPNPIEEVRMPKSGYVLVPGQLYLGVTEEYTETHGYVPFLEGKSSVGRLGIDIHSTAGKGDEGFCNYWTLEMSVKVPVRIYPGMPIGQLIYFEISGPIRRGYDTKANAKYRTVSPHPIPSRMHLNFPSESTPAASRSPRTGRTRAAPVAHGRGGRRGRARRPRARAAR